MMGSRVSAKSEGWMLPAMVFLGLFALYVLALDQGFLLSLVQGLSAFDTNLLHEVVHDVRHAAGFPCH